MRALSLFSGIGALDYGLERAGFEIVGQCETEPFCLAVLEKHWPSVWRHDDVRTLTADLVRERVGRVDLIAGGFPCQDVSSAGKGAGIGGARSGLWFHMARIIAGVRPTWVLVENVPALRTRGADRVLADLEALEYHVWPLVVGAWAAGAPHRRDRVWIVAHRQDDGLEGRAQGERSEAWPTTARGGEGLADPLRRGRDGRASEQERGAEERAAAARAGEGGMGDPAGARCDTGRSGESGAVRDGARREESERRGGAVADASEPGLEGRRVGPGSGKPALSVPSVSSVQRWPARPGDPQHDWEAPRLVEFGVGRATDGPSGGLVRLARWRNRNALKALGNCVVPQVVEMIGRAIHAPHAARSR